MKNIIQALKILSNHTDAGSAIGDSQRIICGAAFYQ